MSNSNKSTPSTLFVKVSDYLQNGDIPDADKHVHSLLVKLIKANDGAAIDKVGALMNGIVANNTVHPRKMNAMFAIVSTVYESIYKMRMRGYDSIKIASDTADVVRKLFLIAVFHGMISVHSSKRAEFAANVNDAIIAALDLIKLPAALKRGKLHNEVMSGRMIFRAGRALMEFFASITTASANAPISATPAPVADPPVADPPIADPSVADPSAPTTVNR